MQTKDGKEKKKSTGFKQTNKSEGSWLIYLAVTKLSTFFRETEQQKLELHHAFVLVFIYLDNGGKKKKKKALKMQQEVWVYTIKKMGTGPTSKAQREWTKMCSEYKVDVKTAMELVKVCLV